MDSLSAVYATIGVGCSNMLMTMVSVVLIDHAGRRTLHLIGLGGMCLCTVILTVALILVAVSIFVRIYSSVSFGILLYIGDYVFCVTLVKHTTL